MRLILLLIVLLCLSNLFPQENIPEKWITLFEKSNYKQSADYEETINYFQKLKDHSDYAQIITFGTTPEGREMKCFITSRDNLSSSVAGNGRSKPVVMIINSIHAGELEGKDASMLLLREILITREKAHLLDHATIMIVPVFNVDGHERRSKYNRINQNGPEEMGWRTTAQNLNLNRDWLKADAPEMQHLLKLFSKWQPDFFIDSHTTNGADYQYVLTYGTEKFQNIYFETAGWIRNNFIPYFETRLENQGILSAPYTGFKDNDLYKGITDWVSPPRLSTGYLAAQNRPSLLIETHMLKPYKERVFATKAAFEAVLEYVNDNSFELIRLNERADVNIIDQFLKQKKYFPIAFKGLETNVPFTYKGIQYVKDSSRISGSSKITYTGKPYEITIPFYNEAAPTDSIPVPSAYIIPAEWKHLAERLNLHGVQIERTDEEKEFIVTRFKFKEVKFAAASYESHQAVTYKYDTYDETVTIPAGSFLIHTDQRTLKIIVYLLDPRSEDSFVRWGFMNSIFERKEYFEDYVMEKIAEEMIKKDPKLLKEFEKKLETDEGLRNSPHARLNFLYERSPYFDHQWNLYPVMIVN